MDVFSPSQLNEYEKTGFLIIRGLFSKDELNPLKGALLQNQSISEQQFTMKDVDGQSHSAIAWVSPSVSYLGMLPFLSRLVSRVEELLGEPCYHWLSKLSIKPEFSKARIEWHQDFPAWHDEGCENPKLVTCGIAIDDLTDNNGIFNVIPGSHCSGNLPHEYRGDAQSRVSPDSLTELLTKHNVEPCRLQIGDAVFFHANLLHGSSGNSTNSSRTLLLCSYNALSNAPPKEKQGVRLPIAIEKIKESQWSAMAMKAIFDGHEFLRPGNGMMQGFGKSAVDDAD